MGFLRLDDVGRHRRPFVTIEEPVMSTDATDPLRDEVPEYLEEHGDADASADVPTTGLLRFSRMAGSSIAARDAALWVTDFLNAAYYRRPVSDREVDDLRLAFCALTTYWYRKPGRRRLRVTDLPAFHRAFGAGRASSARSDRRRHGRRRSRRRRPIRGGDHRHTRYTYPDDPQALARWVAELEDGLARYGEDEPEAVPTGAQAVVGFDLTTHEGHFMGAGHNRLLLYVQDGVAWVRAAGTWDPMPWQIEQIYKIAGRDAQHAFWGQGNVVAQSLLHQLALQIAT
jgi:hypothetical protein